MNVLIQIAVRHKDTVQRTRREKAVVRPVDHIANPEMHAATGRWCYRHEYTIRSVHRYVGSHTPYYSTVSCQQHNALISLAYKQHDQIILPVWDVCISAQRKDLSMWIVNKHLRAKCLPEDGIRWVFQIPFQDESETYPFEDCPHYHLHPFVRTKPQLNSRGSPSMIYRGRSPNRNVIHGIFFSP